MMLKIRMLVRGVVLIAAAVSALAARQAQAAATIDQETSAEKQRKLISVLQSDAAPQDKAVACKRLVIYGTKDAVPALAPLLLDPNLASWARIALETIPDPAAGDALREAVDKLHGLLLVGVINSIGTRRDRQAAHKLAEKLKDADAEVASAAAVALGRVGGDQSVKALEQSLADAPTGVRPAVAEGCILCAERFLNEGKFSAAVKLYDTVRAAKVSKQKTLEATRGTVLALRSAGIPLLVELLRSGDKGMLNIGLSTARELPGREATEALVSELDRSSPDRQPALLLALADRGDAAALPAALKSIKSASPKLRMVAVGLLERLDNFSSVPALLEAAVEDDAELAQAAKAALVRLSAKEVDADIRARLPQSTLKMRRVLIELAGQRQIVGAIPVIMRSAEDADAGVRGAALESIGAIGDEQQAADLVRILEKNQAPKDRADLEKALLAICSRCRAGCLPHLQQLAHSGHSGLRTIALHGLGSVGGSAALAAVKSAIADPDETVQDEAVRTLSAWPNSWPEDEGAAEPLLALTKTGKKSSHQVLGLRGYLQYVEGDKKLKNDEKLVKVNELLPLIKRAEEKRLVIAVLGAIPSAGALESLLTFAADPALVEDACSALVNLAGGTELKGSPRELRQKAFQTVIEKSTNDATKKKAERALRAIK